METKTEMLRTKSTSWNVWIIARPLSGNGIFPASSFAMASPSRGYFSLSHWEVLLTTSSAAEVESIILRQEVDCGHCSDSDLEFLWELHQGVGDCRTNQSTSLFNSEGGMVSLYWSICWFDFIYFGSGSTQRYHTL